ncbi:biotin--[acetyl-CoA-carboxylase] ligase [Ferruginibacter albus]|uniref:biotin--[acetyl-CoA-carboxylase] ligase n=1 Tax=Ferruginibacter albus TaxID=2875540 RepID=UPI001CC7982A|nr:biotin--[acetyl-CoA-carboxylase] ligase [Ferruginibacter albus]UAY51865.1 biotin--[acetyl-CoA-carboxylase] ligase [Ferruginibacter albus]
MPLHRYPITILSSVDSTNNYAMAQVHAGLAKHGFACFAHKQTAGRGQRGKSWHTGHSQNIALSVVIDPGKLKLNNQFYLSASVALGCYDLFSKYAGDETSIKWANDIYWQNRKAGGILIENITRDKSWKWSIAGIGININQSRFSKELKNPVSLKQITGKDFDIEIMAKELHKAVMKRIDELNAANYKSILTEYNEHLYKLNEPVRLKKNNAVFSTVIKSVSANGELHTKDTLERHFTFGEVEWIINV